MFPGTREILHGPAVAVLLLAQCLVPTKSSIPATKAFSLDGECFHRSVRSDSTRPAPNRRCSKFVPVRQLGYRAFGIRCFSGLPIGRLGLRLRGGDDGLNSSSLPPVSGETQRPDIPSAADRYLLALDIGGQHCVGAIRLAGEPTILVQNDISNLETPTAVAFRGGRFSVGAAAADQPATNAANIIQDYLALLGLPAPAPSPPADAGTFDRSCSTDTCPGPCCLPPRVLAAARSPTDRIHELHTRARTAAPSLLPPCSFPRAHAKRAEQMHCG